MNLKRIGKLFGLGLALVFLAMATGSIGTAQAERSCTVTLQPGQSIQRAIDRAAEGDVICLAEGTWRESIKIEKSLTLRGQGQEKTIIKGKEVGYPVIWIESEEVIEVKIEGLTVAEAKVGAKRTWKENGIRIGGEAKVSIQNSTISGNRYEGILMRGLLPGRDLWLHDLRESL